ncbi:MAG: hypothetical protein LKI24_09535 [Acidipropionibacterium sp.]|nr:hypothetical protein [Acidipropionibacterium sp.]
MRVDPVGGESARVGRAAGALLIGAAVCGMVWGICLAIWTASGPDATGDGATGLPVRGWFNGLLVGLLCGAGVAVICLLPVLLCAALGGSRLLRRRRRAQSAGLMVAVLGLAIALAGQYWVVGTWSVIFQISWPAAVLAVVLGVIGGPFVIEGRFGPSVGDSPSAPPGA